MILSTIEFVLRYQFICKWKCMRVMNDNLIVELSIICTTGATLWLSFAKFLSPGREFLPEVSKVEIFLKGRLDLIPSPSQKIQIMDGKVGLMCKGKTLLAVVNKLSKQNVYWHHPEMWRWWAQIQVIFWNLFYPILAYKIQQPIQKLKFLNFMNFSNNQIVCIWQKIVQTFVKIWIRSFRIVSITSITWWIF